VKQCLNFLNCVIFVFLMWCSCVFIFIVAEHTEKYCACVGVFYARRALIPRYKLTTRPTTAHHRDAGRKIMSWFANLGVFRTLPLFFAIGAGVEWFMIHVQVGKETFCEFTLIDAHHCVCIAHICRRHTSAERSRAASCREKGEPRNGRHRHKFVEHSPSSPCRIE
jgi:hypothetical protein